MSGSVYWSVVAAFVGASAVAFMLMQHVYGPRAPTYFGHWVTLLLSFIMAAVAARRLQDAGRSEKYGVLLFVPLVNVLALIVISCLPSAGRTVPGGRAGAAATRRQTAAPATNDL